MSVCYHLLFLLIFCVYSPKKKKKLLLLVEHGYILLWFAYHWFV
jgi:hypothetical protein